MKKNSSRKRGLDPQAQMEKSGWIRKFCGRGLFREIWKNRFVVLRGDQLFICSKEVKEPSRGDEVVELTDFDRCEELRKNRSRSKKSHSKFRLLRSSGPGTSSGVRHTSLLFLALSPEEKESWIQVLNTALTRAKNRVLDQVTVEDSQLFHPTRDRAKIPHTRRPPTRGHLLAVASASDGALTLDLIHEENPQPTTAAHSLLTTDTECCTKPHTLPRQGAPGGRTKASEKSASLDQLHRTSSHESESLSRLQQLILDKMEQTERLLRGLRLEPGLDQGLDQDQGQPRDRSKDPEQTQSQEVVCGEEGVQEEAQQEVHQLLLEARAQWTQAHQVLTQVQELKELYLQLDSRSGAKHS